MDGHQTKPVLITLEYPPQVGGVANYYHSLIRALPLDCAVLDSTQLPRQWWRMIPWLYRQVKQQHYTHILVGQVLPLGTVALVIHWLLGTPYIVFTHGMDMLVPQRYPRKRWLLRRILRQAYRVVTVSSFTAQAIKTFEPKTAPVTVIHPAAAITPMTTIQSVAGLPEQFILSVGRLVERKGFDQVVKSLSQFPELQYVLAGDGVDQARLQQIAQQAGATDRVHFYQHLSDQQIAYLYQHCLFLVMPSRQLADGDVEGFGIVVLEANRFGKVAIGGQAGGMSDAIQHEHTGLLVDGTSSKELVDAIKKMLNVDYRANLEQQAKQYSESQTWEYAARQLLAIVDDNG
ncbi:MAG: glycosyltransferase family 4 protein [Candidatus Kerfeldbacteria bacterium]|nr:glycosyltransferase family 4 protein [Candidatus Kerfeldbacteria bacterium]